MLATQHSVCNILIYVYVSHSHIIIIIADLPVSGAHCTAEGKGIESVVAAGYPTFFTVTTKDVTGNTVNDSYTFLMNVFSEGIFSFVINDILFLRCF